MKAPIALNGFGKSASINLFLRYSVSIGSVLLATLMRQGLNPVLGNGQPFTFFFAAVALTSWYAGFWPSVLAIVLSYVAADWFFIPPLYQLNVHQFGIPEFTALGSFVCSGLAIAFTSRALHRAKEIAQQRQQELAAAHAHLQAHANLLEKRVQERTAHLTETIQSLEGVCYHLAHDLRAPLRAMSGFSETLLNHCEDSLDPVAADCAQRIAKAAGRMDTLLLDLLDYGALGHSQFSLAQIDLEQVLERVLAEAEAEILSRHAQINSQRPLPRVWGNPVLVHQTLTNLLSNALKFAPPGLSPRIEIGAETGPNSARLWVQDHGIGIPLEHQKRVFQIFERLHNAEEYPGTGIGLAIVAKAMQKMKGNVQLASEPEQGTRFSLEFQLPPCGDLKGEVISELSKP
jgi:signal transduction histidine kinase